MSRTYRRLRGDHTGRNSSVRRWGSVLVNGHYQVFLVRDWSPPTKEEIKTLSRYHSDAGWTNHVPGWFTHQFFTVPKRAKEREYLRKIMRLKDLEEAPIFPCENKGRIWYW